MHRVGYLQRFLSYSVIHFIFPKEMIQLLQENLWQCSFSCQNPVVNEMEERINKGRDFKHRIDTVVFARENDVKCFYSFAYLFFESFLSVPFIYIFSFLLLFLVPFFVLPSFASLYLYILSVTIFVL